MGQGLWMAQRCRYSEDTSTNLSSYVVKTDIFKCMYGSNFSVEVP